MHHPQTKFSAWVSIDGREAAEYAVETSDDQQTVTCWIASELGKKFSVHWKNTSYYHDTSGHVKMDGKPCGGRIIRGHTLPTTAEKKGVTDGTMIQPFVFSSLELTDDDAFLGGGSSHPALGVIELNIYPALIPQRTVAPPLLKPLSEIKVHERAKKAVTQQITLATAERLGKPQLFVHGRRTGPDLVKFYFKYRPMDILQANGIAPLPPRNKRKMSVDPPCALTTDEDPDAEDEKNLRDKLKALEARHLKKEKKPPVKREFEASADIDLTQPSKRVKREEKRLFISGEVIDLT
ncbi:hypothetical protein B0H17DRAFT_1020300 [Mycena rosella]|uniref:AdoMet activation domain-containing protein n=1 Tax=Mycena rosella TaxID=1033263 RepID=A0AAD7G6T7_MYCRO|nr:hypothetical protein B0H17DRAFT_1020300 [Mycena rosella]